MTVLVVLMGFSGFGEHIASFCLSCQISGQRDTHDGFDGYGGFGHDGYLP